ncbi:PH domain-containing protein [Riemerella anatipestifer]|uniref:PH domain-containing protein n=1 Tax=Riemerella anatipestifer TaxID=34085 RepID=UPI0021D5BCB9|nr:PH domain-containing protein [Riemerella anatipestifer]MCU7559098.1 PH domain-containing protein [Riemerella anatipestifer]
MKSYQAKLHWISYWKASILMIIGFIGVPFFIIGIMLGRLFDILGIISIIFTFIFLMGLFKFMYLKSIKIYLRDKYLTISGGVLGKWCTNIEVEKIEGCFVNQSLLGLKLGFGTVQIYTQGGKELSLYIKDPNKLTQLLKGGAK